MARKKIREEEIVEMLYQWHIGSTISQVKRYLEIALCVNVVETPSL
ncbi:MAG TPA: hypothetical protein VFG06_07730 [Thermodesulfovibrionales bacterium]|nr:hypothetical protein [Thermodesulfovibrionales bacterium]